MKVRSSSPCAVAARLALPAITLSVALLFSPALTDRAHALTRDAILRRADSWVAKRIPYSQRGTYQGYRRDCSGMVSMAWKLDRSYSSRSIRSRAKRVSLSRLRPGDAVLTPGHVEIFGGWKDKRRRTYVAIGQSTWGGRATKRVRRITGRSVGLRLKTVTETPRPAVPHAVPVAAAVATDTVSVPGT